MRHLVVRFIRNESAATAIEYALIGTLVSVAIIAGAVSLGTQLNVVYNALATKVSAVAGS